MGKITFVGSGSLGFFKNILTDCLTFEALKGFDWGLVDVDEKRLEYSVQIARNLMKAGGSSGKLESSTDRTKILPGSDFVVIAILVGGYEAIEVDIDVPMKYGVDQCIGDTHGPGGVFRALRTIPAMVDIGRDIEELCPNAVVMNYTNPMSMLCRAMFKTALVKLVGLCHSVQGTTAGVAKMVGADPAKIDYWVAGINHQAWIVEMRQDGEDLLSKIVEAAAAHKPINASTELCKHLGYFVTEGAGHNSEYVAWFRKNPEAVKKYCSGGTWEGESGFIKDLYRRPDWEERLKQKVEQSKDAKFHKSAEYGSNIINAVVTGVPYRFNGTVMNSGIVTNLPQPSICEVPCIAEKHGVTPLYVGALPPQLAALNSMHINVIEMTVRAALERDRELAFHAVCMDPLTMAVLDLEQTRAMVTEMFERSKAWLPQFGE